MKVKVSTAKSKPLAIVNEVLDTVFLPTQTGEGCVMIQEGVATVISESLDDLLKSAGHGNRIALYAGDAVTMTFQS